jgi:NAD+ synthase
MERTETQEESTLARSNITKTGDFLKKVYDRTEGKKFLLGLSGGIDSTTLGYIIRDKFGKDVLETFTLVGKRHDKEHIESARLIGEEISHNHRIKRLEDFYNIDLLKSVDPQTYAILIAQAYTFMSNQNRDSHITLLAGNLCEKAAMLSYWGGFLGEVAPFGNYFKSEIRGIAKELGVPEDVMMRVPGTGVRGARTDEENLGVSFEKLERLLLNIEVKEEPEGFSLQYPSLKRETARIAAGLTDAQLVHLEFCILDSTKSWILEGGHPVRYSTELEMATDKKYTDESILFRPSDYSIYPTPKNSDDVDLPKTIVALSGCSEFQKVRIPLYIDRGIEVLEIYRKKDSIRGAYRGA